MLPAVKQERHIHNFKGGREVGQDRSADHHVKVSNLKRFDHIALTAKDRVAEILVVDLSIGSFANNIAEIFRTCAVNS